MSFLLLFRIIACNRILFLLLVRCRICYIMSFLLLLLIRTRNRILVLLLFPTRTRNRILVLLLFPIRTRNRILVLLLFLIINCNRCLFLLLFWNATSNWILVLLLVFYFVTEFWNSVHCSVVHFGRALFVSDSWRPKWYVRVCLEKYYVFPLGQLVSVLVTLWLDNATKYDLSLLDRHCLKWTADIID